MIGYFIKAGDNEVDRNFDPYIWPFRNIIHKIIEGKNYGPSLKLILIKYYLEGKFLEFPDKRIKINPIRKKEQSLSVTIGVPKNFGNWEELDKKKFIVNSTNEALQLVRESLIKKGYTDIDFSQLLIDLEQCARLYFDQ
jgi:uncharacterized protein YjbK